MGKRTNEKTIEIKYLLYIMKALGWYIHIHKEIKRKKIAEKMNIDPSLITKETISPRVADSIDETNYEASDKRIISIERATEICKSMNTKLENVLYFYQFKDMPNILDKIDKLEKLTNLEGEKEDQFQVFDSVISSLNQNKNQLSIKTTDINNLISNVNHPDFKPWFGKYFCYFSSTNSDEAGKSYTVNFDKSKCDAELLELYNCMTDEYIFCGIMDIYSCTDLRDELCHVDFKFLADAKEQIVKKYSGSLTLSASTRAIFCELVSNEQGEKTYFIFENQDLGKGQSHVQCCMAMVLTFSSKVHRRRPCCERMIISSNIIKQGTEEYETMKAYLRMNDNMIRITQWGYDQLIKDIDGSTDPDLLKIAEQFPDLQSLSGQTVTIENCAFIPESMIYALHKLSSTQQRKFETLLRNHSIAPWYCKTKATKADDLFKMLNEIPD